MTLRAEIRGNASACCNGITVTAPALVLALCRKLVEAGYEPAEPLEAYRGDTMCLKVRTIAEGARLAIRGDGIGFRFEGRGVDTASPARSRHSAEPTSDHLTCAHG
jgi:hypothetical protein